MNKSEIKAFLQSKGFTIESEKRNGNDTGYALKLNNGSIINLFDTGKYNCQGKNSEEMKRLLESYRATSTYANRKVFVVYGHDEVARTQLEAMLRRWDLEPLIIDQLESAGFTIIEKLEEYIQQANFGIVLATPDDIGYPKGKESEKKCRVRQNVVLELGMLLARLGRERVAIILKNTEDMEKPSDIHGLIYIPFTNNVEEATVNLVKEMNRNGYVIEIAKL